VPAAQPTAGSARAAYIHDRIINVIDAGRVVESGTHRSLLREDGVYASLYQEHFASQAG
jgi:ABC-type multidrug transport system fused ATPase/permease subunit